MTAYAALIIAALIHANPGTDRTPVTTRNAGLHCSAPRELQQGGGTVRVCEAR